MLYELLVPLAKYHTAFNVFRYITFRAAMALLMTWLSEGELVPLEDPSASFEGL